MRESSRALAAYADYVAMGWARSLRKLQRVYLAAQNSTEQGRHAPTTRLETLKKWSRTFGWQARINEIAGRALAEVEEEWRRSIWLSHSRVSPDRPRMSGNVASEQGGAG